MKLNVLMSLIIGTGFARPGACQAPKVSLVPNDSVIRQILMDRIDKYRQSVGIVVGVMSPRAAGLSPTAQLIKAARIL